MARPLWFVELLKKLYKRRFFIYKMTSWPVIGKIINKNIFRNDNSICITKDKVIPLNKSIEVGKTILPSKIVEYFINKANFHWIMNFCICRTSNKCKKYPQELGCLFLGDAAKGINPQLGRRVTKEEALAHIKKCRDTGLIHWIGRNKFDAVWLGVGPENKLLTICNCCECCCISTGIKFLPPQIAKDLFFKLPGLEVKVTDKCVGCGTCKKICFLDAIYIINKHAVINTKMCRGCGRCVEICPKKAIELNLSDTEFLEKSVNQISSHVII